MSECVCGAEKDVCVDCMQNRIETLEAKLAESCEAKDKRIAELEAGIKDALEKRDVSSKWMKYYSTKRHHPDCDLMEAASFETLGNKCTCPERIYEDVKKELKTREQRIAELEAASQDGLPLPGNSDHDREIARDLEAMKSDDTFWGRALASATLSIWRRLEAENAELRDTEARLKGLLKAIYSGITVLGEGIPFNYDTWEQLEKEVDGE